MFQDSQDEKWDSGFSAKKREKRRVRSNKYHARYFRIPPLLFARRRNFTCANFRAKTREKEREGGGKPRMIIFSAVPGFRNEICK